MRDDALLDQDAILEVVREGAEDDLRQMAAQLRFVHEPTFRRLPAALVGLANDHDPVAATARGRLHHKVRTAPQQPKQPRDVAQPLARRDRRWHRNTTPLQERLAEDLVVRKNVVFAPVVPAHQRHIAGIHAHQRAVPAPVAEGLREVRQQPHGSLLHRPRPP